MSNNRWIEQTHEELSNEGTFLIVFFFISVCILFLFFWLRKYASWMGIRNCNRLENTSKFIEFSSFVACQPGHAKSNHLKDLFFVMFYCAAIHRYSRGRHFLYTRGPDSSMPFIALDQNLVDHLSSSYDSNKILCQCELPREREKKSYTQWLRQMLMKFPLQAAIFICKLWLFALSCSIPFWHHTHTHTHNVQLINLVFRLICAHDMHSIYLRLARI